MTDLTREFTDSVCNVDAGNLRTIFAAGVPEKALDPLLFGVCPIETHGTTFEPVDEGEPTVIVPCGWFDGLNWHLTDLAAFRLDDPSRWWRRLGVADVLGNVHGFTVEPKPLHATPLDWLRDAGKGLVILDWSCDPMDLLLGAGHLQASKPVKDKLLAVAQMRAAREIEELLI
jgi:hypothetical protein